MKITRFFFVMTFLATINISAQEQVERIINEVEFKSDKILLEKKEAFNYRKDGNHFLVLDLNNNELIIGDITSLGDGKFSSVITFVAENKKFSNAKIIGRSDLFFAMLNNNVITKEFKIDPEKLDLFFAKYNELKN
ncbi:hypothetical protein IR010_05740 [Flavobacterium sp. MR2016-29]|uniref:hypothetical protein n=1 Tax=Flavobacterium sp. MR2016-29 TaxID=2783795 RepID=UPI00188BC987|nr:hypothetical protein [Flavobacterium sp. MR2016-29]MBF4492039.1 hypothetical protein [Flavobacterium sp. MR2016-29]